MSTRGEQPAVMVIGAYQSRPEAGGCGTSSTGSWDTTFSSEESGMPAQHDYSNSIGSPVGHLHSFDRTQSAPFSHLGQHMAASLSLEDSPFAAQAGMADAQSLGWGGRPLHASHPPQHPSLQQQQQQALGRRRSLDDYSASGYQSAGHNNHNQGMPRPRSPRNSGHSGNNAAGGGGPQRMRPPSGPPGPNHLQQQHQRTSLGSDPRAAAAAAAAGVAKGQGYRRLWQQVTAVNRGGRLGKADAGAHGEATVEDLLELVRRLPPNASAVKAVAQGLYYLDSGALAALLKELNKAGHARRAQEIFDWLRALDPGHDLYALANTMTYTTMISQCGSQQQLRRALELVAEMRGRGVQCNVHTYSALMNVCIKANELDLALDVYRQMLAEGCHPNLVTYNTLIDVYGKTGAWQEAIRVLDTLAAAGIQPEVRTYNTVIIACNQSSRAQEALAVYERMLAAGAQPTATTYTALISAYGKAGQLDAALQIFQDMVRRGCERNVITYSSLISACEKAGRWELALELFREMHAEGCRPNVVTYNSLIAACAQGAQWEKAQELFDAMRGKGCRPDSVTFGGLIAAYDRAGRWRRALTAFEQMRAHNCRPDSVVYNTIVGALWKTGLVWAQGRAAQIFHSACRQGHFRLTVRMLDAAVTAAARAKAAAVALEGAGGVCGSPRPGLFSSDGGAELPGVREAWVGGLERAASAPSPSGGRSPSPVDVGSPLSLEALAAFGADAACPTPPTVIEFGMHAFTVGSAVLSVLRWASELRDRLPCGGPAADGHHTVSLLLNKGKPSREHAYPAIRAALVSLLAAWSSPFTLTDIPQGCRIEAPAAAAADWLASPVAEAALNAYHARAESPRSLQRDAFFHEDALTEARCAEAFAAVRRFESSYAAAGEAVAGGKTEGSCEPSHEGGEKEAGGESSESGSGSEPASPASSHAATSAQRREWFRTAAVVAAAFHFSDEVLHDAFLLVERAASAGGEGVLAASPSALVVACLLIAAQQAGEHSAHLPPDEGAQQAAGLAPGEVAAAQDLVRSLLASDTSCISALRVLKLYLERLGADFATTEGLAAVAGAALGVLPSAVCDARLRRRDPSLVAAAVLLAGRKAAGVTPFWPHALIVLTGLTDEEGSQLCVTADVAFDLA